MSFFCWFCVYINNSRLATQASFEGFGVFRPYSSGPFILRLIITSATITSLAWLWLDAKAFVNPTQDTSCFTAV